MKTLIRSMARKAAPFAARVRWHQTRRHLSWILHPHPWATRRGNIDEFPCVLDVRSSPRSRELHNKLWKRAAEPGFVRRRIYDARTALGLRAFGVTDFATLNLKDFQDFGFRKVWNPLST